MERQKLNRLCDRTLKALVNPEFKEPHSFEINNIDNEVTLKEDFFKKINISQEEIPFVLEVLGQDRFITQFTSGASSRQYNHDLGKQLVHEISSMSITKPGAIFIKSTSYRLESMKVNIIKWIPLIISGISIVITFAFSYISCNRESKQQEINKKVEGLNGRIDSLVSTIQAKKIPEDTSKAKALKK
jgi:uncharacterized membrane protein